MGEGSEGIRIENREQFEAWLDRKEPSRGICIALAARIASRTLPLAAKALPSGVEVGPLQFPQFLAALFRASALARAVAKYPTRADQLQATAARLAAAANSSVAYHASDLDARYHVAYAAAAAAAGAAGAAGAVDPSTSAAAAAAVAAEAFAFAAHSAAYLAANDNAFWEALSADVSLVEAGLTSRDLADAPLWPKGAPDLAKNNWASLVTALPDADRWGVWMQWYEARLRGGSRSETREIVFATVPIETWDDGPAAANAWIAERLGDLDSGEISAHVRFGDAAEAEIRSLPHEWDFFISYNEKDRAFALFVDDVLRKAGYRVFAQFRDMPAGSDFIVEMNRGLAVSGRLVAILSPHYVCSKFCQAEWNAAYRVDPLAEGRKVIPLLIEATDLSPLAASRVYKSLVGLTSDRATAAVLDAVGYNGVVTPSIEWPGAQALDDMSRNTRGVFDVRPAADGRLDRVYIESSDAMETDYGFSKEELYADARQSILDYIAYLNEPERSNLDRNLIRTALVLLSAFPEELANCRPLYLNRALSGAISAIDLLDRAGELPQNDFVRHYQAELRGIYERLAAFYPQLPKYREMARKDRQTSPNDEARAFLSALLERTGDIATPQLANELRETSGDLHKAEESLPPGASDAQRKEVMYEPLKSASAQAIPVWNWLANAAEKFKASGKSASEVSSAIESYTKLAKQIPGAGEFFKWLADWWY